MRVITGTPPQPVEPRSRLPLLDFRCSSCGECCRTLRVPLTDVDLARLRASTGEPFGTLVDWLTPDDVDMTGEPETFVLLREGRRLATLVRRDGACRFFDGQRCGVYAARPTSCRTYPLQPRFDGEALAALGLLDGSACRHETDGAVDIDELRRDDEAERRELAAFAARVQRWNQRQRTRARLGRRLLLASDFLAWIAAAEPTAQQPPSATTNA